MAKGKMPAFMMAKFEKSGADKKEDAKGAKGMAKKGMAPPFGKKPAFKKGGMVGKKGSC